MDEKKIWELIEYLTGGPTYRSAAVRLLEENRDHAIPELIKALEHVNASIRENAADMLGMLCDERAVYPLIKAFEDGRVRAYVACPALEHFAEAGLDISPALNALLMIIDRTDWRSNWVSEKAVGLLVKIGEPAIPGLTELLNDERRNVYELAIKALSKIGGEQAFFAISEKLKDDIKANNIGVYEVLALGNIGGPATFLLTEALKNPSCEVKGAAAEALGDLKDPRSVPALVEVFKYENPKYGKIHHIRMREHVEKALVKIGKPAVPVLIESLKNKNGVVREGAATALVGIGDFSALPALVEVLKDSRSAVFALEKILDNSQAIETINEMQEIKEIDVFLQEGYDRLKKNHKKEDLTEVQIMIAKLRMECAKRKNDLAEDKGDLLDRRLKPPKRGMYQATRTGNSQQRRRSTNG